MEPESCALAPCVSGYGSTLSPLTFSSIVLNPTFFLTLNESGLPDRSHPLLLLICHVDAYRCAHELGKLRVHLNEVGFEARVVVVAIG